MTNTTTTVLDLAKVCQSRPGYTLVVRIEGENLVSSLVDPEGHVSMECTVPPGHDLLVVAPDEDPEAKAERAARFEAAQARMAEARERIRARALVGL